MIRYSLKWGAEVFLDVDDTDTQAPIQVTGNPEYIAIIMEALSSSYGAFGHLIGAETTAPDLAVAMSSAEMERFKPELVEGEGLTKVVANIPEGVMT